jgi:hypothetical protein
MTLLDWFDRLAERRSRQLASHSARRSALARLGR